MPALVQPELKGGKDGFGQFVGGSITTDKGPRIGGVISDQHELAVRCLVIARILNRQPFQQCQHVGHAAGQQRPPRTGAQLRLQAFSRSGKSIPGSILIEIRLTSRPIRPPSNSSFWSSAK